MPIMSPSDPNADNRLQQVAALLARGVQRYTRLARRSGSLPEKEFIESWPTGLEVPGKPRLSVSRRIGG